MLSKFWYLKIASYHSQSKWNTNELILMKNLFDFVFDFLWSFCIIIVVESLEKFRSFLSFKVVNDALNFVVGQPILGTEIVYSVLPSKIVRYDHPLYVNLGFYQLTSLFAVKVEDFLSFIL